MKKYLAAAAAMLLLGGFALADDTGGNMPAGKDTGMKTEHMKKDCIMMKDGKMMVTKDGKQMMMTENMALSNGTMVMPDGSYTTKDGTKMMLKEGEMMGMDGKVWKGHMKKDCVMMKGGKMMVMKAGKEMAMTENMTMANGTTVMPDGSYTTKDGAKMMFNDGEKMGMDGKIWKKKMDKPM